jgi:hypothetical protein
VILFPSTENRASKTSAKVSTDARMGISLNEHVIGKSVLSFIDALYVTLTPICCGSYSRDFVVRKLHKSGRVASVNSMEGIIMASNEILF